MRRTAPSLTTVVLPLLLLAVLAILTPRAALAQRVTASNTGYGSTRRAGDRAATDLDRADWPRVADGEAGTQVHVTFDLRNADIVLIARKDYGLDPLLNEARRLARAIGRPRADYFTYPGTKTVTVDIELNKYLRHPAKRRTESELDLSALAAALRSSRLPKPAVLFIDAEAADEALLSVPGVPARRLDEETFLGLDEVPAGARLRFVRTLPAYAPIAAAGLVALFLSGPVGVAILPWRVARLRARQRAQAAPSAPPDPDQVQKEYDRQPPLWIVTAGIPLVLFVLFLAGDVGKVFDAAFEAMPGWWRGSVMTFYPLAALAVGGISALACALVERARARRDGRPAREPADPDAPPAWVPHSHLLALLIPLTLMILMTKYLLSGQPRPPGFRYLAYATIGLMPAAMIVRAWLVARATRRKLGPCDPWHDRVREVAAAAGVRVRGVVRVQATEVNAYASIFGTVGLTAGLLRKMEPDEVRAVIAHEIGHFRGGHVRRSFALSLALTVGSLAVWWFGTESLKGHVNDYAFGLLRSPVVTVFLLPPLANLILGRGRRRREEEADRFAVEYTGDPELVIRTLVKLHTLNASPHALKRSDEALAAHPSLVHRIEAIRRASARAADGSAGRPG